MSRQKRDKHDSTGVVENASPDRGAADIIRVEVLHPFCKVLGVIDQGDLWRAVGEEDCTVSVFKRGKITYSSNPTEHLSLWCYDPAKMRKERRHTRVNRDSIVEGEEVLIYSFAVFRVAFGLVCGWAEDFAKSVSVVMNLRIAL